MKEACTESACCESLDLERYSEDFDESAKRAKGPARLVLSWWTMEFEPGHFRLPLNVSIFSGSTGDRMIGNY